VEERDRRRLCVRCGAGSLGDERRVVVRSIENEKKYFHKSRLLFVLNEIER
jgi:hypothetical protein